MNTEHQLKVAVERIVRPIVASEADKLKMRRELYAHALDAYGQERSKGNDLADALRSTLDRLGDAAVTRAELQSTVGWQSKLAYVNDRIMRRQPGVSLLRHAMQVGLLTGFALLLTKVFLIFPMELDEFWQWTFKGRLLLWMSVTLSVMFGVGMFFGIIYSDFAMKLGGRRFAQPGDWLRCIGLMLAVTTTLAAIGWCFVFAVAQDYATSSSTLIQWLAFAAVIAPAFPLLAWLDIKERRPLAEWLGLDLKESPVLAD